MYVVMAVVSIVCALAVDASAQSFEAAGVRAQGMAGAFVAVADDASATWWNPAGLANGPLFNAALELDRGEVPRDRPEADGSRRTRVGAFSAAIPALGLSYYHFRISEIRRSPAATGTSLPSRQDQGPGGVSLSALAVSQFGITVGQSLGDHLVVGSTLKLLRGHAAVDGAASADLDAADALDGPGSFAATLDAGALATFGAFRAGVVVRNLTEPEFGAASARLGLTRQARVGASATRESDGVLGAVTIALDADVTRTPTAAGDSRQVAVGAESWWWGRRIGVRGGVRANTVGDTRMTPAIGGSVGLGRGFFADGSLAGSGADTGRAWGIGLRVTF